MLILISQTVALAHASLERIEASAGQIYQGVLKIGHGCAGSATRDVTIMIPEGLLAVTPTPKAGWNVTARPVASGPSPSPVRGMRSDGIGALNWSGGSLPDGVKESFLFEAELARDLPVGTQLVFPVIQICDKGRHDWIDKPVAGQDPKTLTAPAPVVTVVSADAKPVSGPTMTKAGPLVIEAARTRVTPRGAPVAGGYVTIRNEGTQPDRLISASITIADRTEIHEMSRKDGVMIMRALPEGLPIKPGETVELKPGSFHLMFLQPKRPLVEGEVLQGELVFEKAGPVAVEFKVEGMGGNRPAPASGHSGHVH